MFKKIKSFFRENQLFFGGMITFIGISSEILVYLKYRYEFTILEYIINIFDNGYFYMLGHNLITSFGLIILVNYFERRKKETIRIKSKNISSANIYKNNKSKPLYITLIIILSITTLASITTTVILQNQKNKEVKSLKNDIKKIRKELKNKKEKLKEYSLNEPCIYWPVGNVSKIMISAESSAGVGDIFSRMDSNLSYRLHDNKIGDVYNVIVKYEGNPSIYKCDESWYLISIGNGRYGYVWGGYKDMYVRELE